MIPIGKVQKKQKRSCTCRLFFQVSLCLTECKCQDRDHDHWKHRDCYPPNQVAYRISVVVICFRFQFAKSPLFNAKIIIYFGDGNVTLLISICNGVSLDMNVKTLFKQCCITIPSVPKHWAPHSGQFCGDIPQELVISIDN